MLQVHEDSRDKRDHPRHHSSTTHRSRPAKRTAASATPSHHSFTSTICAYLVHHRHCPVLLHRHGLVHPRAPRTHVPSPRRTQEDSLSRHRYNVPQWPGGCAFSLGSPYHHLGQGSGSHGRERRGRGGGESCSPPLALNPCGPLVRSFAAANSSERVFAGRKNGTENIHFIFMGSSSSSCHPHVFRDFIFEPTSEGTGERSDVVDKIIAPREIDFQSTRPGKTAVTMLVQA